MVLRHFAWFRRDTGQWLGEWRGLVEPPAIDPSIVGDERLRQLDVWQQQRASELAPMFTAIGVLADADGDQVWNIAAWHDCPDAGAVCVDVTRFGWPVGDHVWHVWDDAAQSLDWPESSMHTFIEVQMNTLEVVGSQQSHRPVRDRVPGRRVFDITGSPLAAHYGRIHGRFVWCGDRWGFEPSRRRRWTWAGFGRPFVPAALRRELAAARVDLDLFDRSTARVEVLR